MATSTLDRKVRELSEPGVSDAPRAGRWRNDHSVNIRASVPLLGSRWYVTVLAGKERRSVERRREEQHKHPMATSSIVIFVLIGLLLGGGVWLTMHSLLLWIVRLINA